MARKIEKIDLRKNAARLEPDLGRYQAQALELGASRARVLDAKDIPVDDRVTLKCQIPRCFGFGVCANCPPHALKPQELRDLLTHYARAVFFTLEVAPTVIARDKATILERVAAYQKVFQIVNALESLAFYDGHYLAVGFAAGSCRHTLCGKEDNCQALAGQKCRFALRARPSMEAVGIDVYKLAADSGWDIYPLGSSAQAADIPKGTLAGLVVVA